LQIEACKKGKPITHETLFEDLPDQMQQFVKSVQDKVQKVCTASHGLVLAFAITAEPSRNTKKRAPHRA
jgi:hypothetical protein